MRVSTYLCLFFSVVMVACSNADQSKPSDIDKDQEKPVILADSLLQSRQPVNNYAPIDRSPMDMSYFPVDYPIIKTTIDSSLQPVMRVIYSRPHLTGRRLFHEVVKYGEPWRLGANESTEIDIYKSVSIQGKKINTGRYVIYCIPHEKEWTIVLNGNIDSWGLKQDASKDLYRFNVPVSFGNPMLEYFTMVFEKEEKGADLVIGWDEVLARVPFRF